MPKKKKIVSASKKTKKSKDEQKIAAATILEAMIDGVCVVDINGRLIQCNATYANMHGFNDPKEIIGKNITELIAEREISRAMNEIKKNLETGITINFEFVAKDKNNREFPCLINATALKDEKCKIVGIVGALRDITELKKAEEALQKNREWLLTTLKSIGDAVIATDLEGRVVLMNSVAENLTGWKQEEAAGKPLNEIFNIINEKTGKLAENPVARVMREGIVVGLANHTVLIAKGGAKYPIDDSGAPIKDDKGNIIGVILVFRDISEQKVSQAQLEERLRNLEKFQKFAVERENRIIKLKEKVKELEARLDGE